MQDDNKYKTYYIDDSEPQDDEINIREVFEKYSFHWKWFVVGTIFALIVAFIYLRYASYQYEVTATILIDDEEKGSITSELSAFEDLGILKSAKTSLETEMGILKSRTLMENVIKDLNLNITYFSKGRIAKREIYKKEVPVNINFFISDSVLHQLDTSFSISGWSDNKISLINSDGEKVTTKGFGEKIICDFGDIIITPVKIKNNDVGEEIFVKISPVKEVANKYREILNIVPESKQSNLLILTVRDPVRLKAKEILDNLIWQYNKNAVEDKSQIAKNTDKFINERLEIISGDLSDVDLGVEEFKTKNRLTDLAAEAGIILQSTSELNKKIVELNTQIKLTDYMINYVKNSKDDLIPTNLGLPDESNTINTNTDNYNKLMLERNRLMANSSELNPIVINLTDQISKYKESIIQRLVNLKSSLQISLDENKKQELRSSQRTTLAPKQEREIRDIQRQQQIIETLYLYLLQKREENSITLAVTAPNAKIIDSAEGSDIPVSPKKIIVYLVALLMGVLIPFIIIYIRFFLDNKIHILEDVENVVKAPILGDIPTTKSEKKVIISEQDKSNVAESFRLLRTNVNFMLPRDLKGGKTIFITSTIGGEGKTFIAINLASAMALLNKKILLIGADIRKPKIATYLKTKQEKGLTHFLIDSSLKVTDVIAHHKETNLDVLESGVIPPNPSELLTNGRFDEVIAHGKANYDYIIIDTAPVNIVTDTLLLGHHADLFVFVIRANFLDKRLLKIPKTMYENKRLPNMAILINDTNYEKRGYGYGYGYGYGQKEVNKSWWKKKFNIENVF